MGRVLSPDGLVGLDRGDQVEHGVLVDAPVLTVDPGRETGDEPPLTVLRGGGPSEPADGLRCAGQVPPLHGPQETVVGLPCRAKPLVFEAILLVWGGMQSNPVGPQLLVGLQGVLRPPDGSFPAVFVDGVALDLHVLQFPPFRRRVCGLGRRQARSCSSSTGPVRGCAIREDVPQRP